MTSPTGLALTLLHDGRVLMELLVDWYHVLAVDEARADDDSIGEVIERWTGARLAESRRRSVARGDLGLAFADGYLATLNENGERALGRTRWSWLRAVLTEPTDPSAATKVTTELTSDVRSLLRRSRRLAADRDAGGAYRAVLTQYLDQLRSYRAVEDQGVYRRLEPTIGAILRDEQYLLLATDPQLRALYLQVRAEMTALYNWCMDLDRGGVERPR